jgi:hypothetical protein
MEKTHVGVQHPLKLAFTFKKMAEAPLSNEKYRYKLYCRIGLFNFKKPIVSERD